MGDSVESIHGKIRSFQRKYYLNVFIRGAILTLTILGGYFILASVVEHTLWLSQWMRLLIFIAFFGVAGFCVYRFLMAPLKWWVAHQGLTEEQTAKLIGESIPTVKDRLLNLIQLAGYQSNSSLAAASVQQKAREFEPVSFETVIDLGENRKYLKYLAIPLIVMVAILILNSGIITQSTERIVHFNREYSPQAPFDFKVLNENLHGYYNEDFTFKLSLEGSAVPENAYLVSDNQRIKLEPDGPGQFSYTFQRLQQPMTFQVEAAGFFSPAYELELINRPELTSFGVELQFPRYIQRKNEKLSNAGNLEIPEGTTVTWQMRTAFADKATMKFLANDTQDPFQGIDNQSFKYSKLFKDPDQYEIVLENEKSKNRDRITYDIAIIKDQHPQIAVSNYRDSVLYQRVVLGGNIGDDYGVTDLQLHYRILNDDQSEFAKKNIRIPISKNQLQQNFFFNWSLDSLQLQPGQVIEYYLQVWDNDGVNGRKSTKSGSYTFAIPTQKDLVAQISKSQNETEKTIDKSVNKANKLQDQIEQANQKLKGKQSLDWQDKKMLDDILQQKKNLDQAVNELKEQNELLDEKKDAFTEQNERIKEKAEQLQKLMNELLDEETKKLFEELQKLMEENPDVSQIQKLLDKLNQNANNLEKELERTLELFKELQYEFKLDQTIQDLKNQIGEQQELLDKTESLQKEQKGQNQKEQKDQKGNKGKENQDSNQDSQNEKNNEANELAKEQEELMKEFDQTKDKLDELEKLGEELDKEEQMPSEQEQQEIQNEQEQSKEMLKQNSPSKASPSQKKALQKMQQMQQQMEGMQSSMMMEMDMENIESLRQIIHGLVKLSFDQEGLMKDFNELQQSDPRFNNLAQKQLKLKDDAKVLEDSLSALGKKDPMMGSFITKEIGELNNHLDKAIEANRERRRPQAMSEMQMSMTSINNLALMLDDHFDMMMQMMANAQPSSGKKGAKKPMQKPSLSQMQQQLNDRIQQLKNSGKGGREYSEELAKMAAEQERIRRALQEMQEKMKNQGVTPGGDLPGKMEQTEMDLVNKQLTDQLIKRQKEIMTRLLETEKSMREQDMDEERKGETAKDYEKEIPKAFEDYLRLKEKEVELLKTVPPKLYPYYKKEVSEYFKRLGNK
jgi:hypothetical protein